MSLLLTTLEYQLSPSVLHCTTCTLLLPSLYACDGRGSESISELRNVLRAKAHGTIVVDRVAVNPACPYWAHMLVSLFIVR
jgi:hypothetical protein